VLRTLIAGGEAPAATACELLLGLF